MIAMYSGSFVSRVKQFTAYVVFSLSSLYDLGATATRPLSGMSVRLRHLHSRSIFGGTPNHHWGYSSTARRSSDQATVVARPGYVVPDAKRAFLRTASDGICGANCTRRCHDRFDLLDDWQCCVESVVGVTPDHADAVAGNSHDSCTSLEAKIFAGRRSRIDRKIAELVDERSRCVLSSSAQRRSASTTTSVVDHRATTRSASVHSLPRSSTHVSPSNAGTHRSRRLA